MVRSDTRNTECDIDISSLNSNRYQIMSKNDKEDRDFCGMNFPTVLQWNINGVLEKKEELQLLVKSLKPVVICLQETHLSPKADISDYLKNYNVYRNDFTDGLIACGGVANLVSKNVYSELLPIRTNLQAIAVKIKVNWLSYDLSICNIYIRPDTGFKEQDLTHIVNQIPKPCILCGDFNSHSKLWNASKCNANGKEMEEFLQKNYDLFLLNGNDITHVNSSYRTCSTLDLTFVSSSIAHEASWMVHNDTCHSDHFPVLTKIHSLQDNNVQRSNRVIWLYKRADWLKYQNLITFHDLQLKNDMDINCIINDMNKDILEAANSAIPKLNISKVPRMVPWWNEVVKRALKERSDALRIYKSDRSLENFINYKRKKAKARYEIKASKKGSWMLFVESINEPVSQSEMWNKIGRFRGKKKRDPISVLKSEDGTLTLEKKEIADILARSYMRNSSDDLYSEEFKENRRILELSLNQPDLNPGSEQYNMPFTYNELIRTFKSCKSAAVGVDKISYQMIKNLPQTALIKLLEIFNFIWAQGVFPNCWNVATVIPILKPNKDKLNPINYRPISLLSCVNKIFERMINVRLSWLIYHTPSLNDPFQSGNRQRRSTVDNLMWLEQEVLTAFEEKEIVVAVLLDIEKAYERTTSISVMKKLIEAGVKGPLYYYLRNFMDKPQICVQVGDTKSNTYILDNSIRQGSSLSGNIFGVSVADVSKVIPKKVSHSMFVDDMIIFMRHKNLDIIQQNIQTTLNNLYIWSQTNGLKFSFEKTNGILFSKRKIYTEPTLIFNSHKIEFKQSIKWLGLFLDSKWSFKIHIVETRKKCMKALNVMKIMSNKNWGLSRICLLKLFNAFIRPILEYGCVIYGGVNDQKLQALNTIYHAALRLISGAFRTSPVKSLYVESGQAPLTIRRKILLNNYVTKVLSYPENPGHSLLKAACFVQHEENTRISKSVSNRMLDLPLINRAEIAKNIIIKDNLSPPWTLETPDISYLTNENKKWLIPVQIKLLFIQFKNKNHGSLFLFTDGSKTSTNTGFAYQCKDFSRNYKLNPVSSIFTAESLAIYKCLEHILSLSTSENFLAPSVIICTDSRSSLDALKSGFCLNEISFNILCTIQRLKEISVSVKFLWIPSHSGIVENDEVDQAAKNSGSAVLLRSVAVQDILLQSKHAIYNEWKAEWLEDSGGNKLKEIKKDIKPWNSSNWRNRRDEIAVCRLRIGHSKLTHEFLFKKTSPPICGCGGILSIKHILLECRLYTLLRDKWKIEKSMVNILNDNEDNILRCLNFFKDAKIYVKLF